jgi:hypothetical protein
LSNKKHLLLSLPRVDLADDVVCPPLCPPQRIGNTIEIFKGSTTSLRREKGDGEDSDEDN